MPAVEALRAHGLKCAIKQANLSEESWSLCTFCPTIFFFSDLTKSPFFIAHMNNQHRKKIEPSWSFPCQRCNSIFPTIEAAEHHRKLCYKSIPKIILKGHHQVPENSLQITSATSIMKPKSMLMPSLKPLVTYQVLSLSRIKSASFGGASFWKGCRKVAAELAPRSPQREVVQTSKAPNLQKSGP